MQNGESIQSGDAMSQSGDVQNGDTIQSETLYRVETYIMVTVYRVETCRMVTKYCQSGDTMSQSGDTMLPYRFFTNHFSIFNIIFLPSGSFHSSFPDTSTLYLIPTERASCPALLIHFNLIASTIMNSTNYVTSVHFFTPCSYFLPQLEIFTRSSSLPPTPSTYSILVV